MALFASSPTAAMAQDWWREGWAVSGFGGPLTLKDSNEIYLKGEWSTESWIIGVAASKALFKIGSEITVEGEAQTVRRFSGQDLWEFNGLMVGRWHLPLSEAWPHTELSAGYGLTYATKKTDDGSDNEPPNKLMAILMFEVAVRPSAWPVTPILRYQHRSSTFGLFGGDGLVDESTSFSLGLRYAF